MYLNSSLKNYEKKYKKYKNKYKILKIHIGGNCDPLPNPEEDDFSTTNNLLDLCPDERITIQNKCYEVSALYRWIITDNHNILPSTQTVITSADKQRLIQAHDALSKILNILTRNKVIKLYPNLHQETGIDLSHKGYTNIALDTFYSLPIPNKGIMYQYLKKLYLSNNQINVLQSDTFSNLSNLDHLDLSNNQISEIQPGSFNNLPNLCYLDLDHNQISEIQPNIFNNLPVLESLSIRFNKITELKPNIFTEGTFGNNLSRLKELNLSYNQINTIYMGAFNNLLRLTHLYLNNNQINILLPGIFADTLGNNLPNLKEINLNMNHLRVREFQPNEYYGLSTYVSIYK
jgi:hypothetical protein